MVNQGNGGEPYEPPSPSSSEYYSFSSHSHHLNSPHQDASKMPFFKLDVKFDFLVFNGEANAK